MLHAQFFGALVDVIVATQPHAGHGLLEWVVVVNGVFHVDHHAQGHEPRAMVDSQGQAHFCMLDCQLVALHTLGKVQLLDCILQQYQKLSLHFLHMATAAQDAAAHVHLSVQHAVHKGLD